MIDNEGVLATVLADQISRFLSASAGLAVVGTAIGAVATLIGVLNTLWKDRNDATKRTQLVDDAGKEASFWKTALEVSSLVLPDDELQAFKNQAASALYKLQKEVSSKRDQAPKRKWRGIPITQIISRLSLIDKAAVFRWLFLVDPIKRRVVWIPRVFFWISTAWAITVIGTVTANCNPFTSGSVGPIQASTIVINCFVSGYTYLSFAPNTQEHAEGLFVADQHKNEGARSYTPSPSSSPWQIPPSSGHPVAAPNSYYPQVPIVSPLPPASPYSNAQIPGSNYSYAQTYANSSVYSYEQPGLKISLPVLTFAPMFLFWLLSVWLNNDRSSQYTSPSS